MNDTEKSKEQLVAELAELRAQIDQADGGRLQRVMANAHCILWEMDVAEREGRLFWDMKYLDEEAAQDILPLELASGESYQQAWDRAIDPDDFSRIADNATRALRAGLEKYTHEYRCSDRRGNLVWLGEEVVVKKRAPAEWNLFAVCTDITRFKRLENELHKSQEQTHAIVDSIVDPIITIDELGHIQTANLATEKVFGYALEEILGQNIKVLMPDPYQSEHDNYLRNYRTTGVKKIIGIGREMEGLRKDGSIFPMQLTVCEVDYPDKILFTGIVRDISKRRQAEEALREKEQQWQLFSQATNSLLWNWDFADDSVERNIAFETTFGYSNKDVSPTIAWWIERLHDEDRERVMAVFQETLDAKKSTCSYSYRFRRKDGSYADIEDRVFILRDASGVGVRALGAMTDITERIQLEEKIRKNHNSEMLGILAGGIAHDFNNMLTGIICSFSLLEMLSDSNSEAHKIAREGNEAAEQTRLLTQQLLTFAKGGMPLKESIDIEKLLRKTVGLTLSGSNTKPTYHLEADLYPVDIDSGQISQVLQNLVLNAAQSMPEGGMLHVGASNVEVDELLPMASGRYVKITIADQGSGMSPEVMDKIFNPYFTTKTTGHGLGLATVHSIIRRHGGHITVQSTVGTGTTFTFYLPAAEQDAQPAAQTARRVTSGTGRILLLDDQEIIHRSMGKMLAFLGYEVESAYSCEEMLSAYRAAQSAGQPFDAVIMDLTIPGGMGGKDAVRELLKIDPQVCALVSSGYADDPVMAEFAQYGFAGRVVKPVDMQVFSQTLNNALEQRAQRKIRN
jgi:PAS domain S-box-containing protein